MPAPNKGGTVDVDGVRFTLTNAFHSGSAPDGSYAGEPSGIVVAAENGTTVYFAGDTCVFGDMQLIGRIYEPDVAVIPIGDHYTMGPREAAVALELLGTKRCVPCHWGTFPVLTGTPQQLQDLAPDGVVIETIEPGDSVTI
jgi:L-ascorbate metabolism protein UlaG (beta-lactamase superfamily)